MKKRYFGLDLIRFIAVLFVPAVHFFKNSSFYSYNLLGKKMFILTFFRWLFFLCVPLFLLLTGYLKSNVDIGKKGYLKGLIRIIVSYIFISLVALLFRKFYLNENITIVKAITDLFNFEAVGYAWYINMYIGLFILIPFLNVLYKNLKTKKNKQYLILSLLAITSLSPIFNMGKIDGTYLKIIPDWWNNIYPLVYYFIGCYIKEYQITVTSKKGLIIFLLILSIESIASFIYSYNVHFGSGFFGGYNCIATIFLASILFVLLYKTDCKKSWITKPITLISEISLDIYLFSWISDKIIYTALNKIFIKPKLYWNYFIPIILATFILATIFAVLKKLIFSIFSKVLSICKKRLKA